MIRSFLWKESVTTLPARSMLTRAAYRNIVCQLEVTSWMYQFELCVLIKDFFNTSITELNNLIKLGIVITSRTVPLAGYGAE